VRCPLDQDGSHLKPFHILCVAGIDLRGQLIEQGGPLGRGGVGRIAENPRRADSAHAVRAQLRHEHGQRPGIADHRPVHTHPGRVDGEL